MLTTDQLLSQPNLQIEEIFALYDQLDVTQKEDLVGLWKGQEIHTGSKYNGLLQQTGWYGKLFLPSGKAHPLLFPNNLESLRAINPKWIPFDFPVPKGKLLQWGFQLVSPFLQTKQPKASVVEKIYRGRKTAAMVYDDIQITDYFVKVNETKLLGIMEKKGDPNAFAFLLAIDKKDWDFHFTVH